MERQLVDHLVARAVVSRQDIQRCMLRASMSKGSVVEELLTRAGVDERVLARAMAEHFGLSVHEMPSIHAQAEALALLDLERSETYGVLAVVYDKGAGKVQLAIFDLDRARPIIQEVREATGISPSLVIAPRSTIEREVFRHYNHEHAADKTVAAPAQPSMVAMSRSARPARHMPGEQYDQATRVVHLDDSGPTRQVDVASVEDNPFLDLLKNARDTAPQANLTKRTTPGIQTSDDFFDGFEDAFTDALNEHQLGGGAPKSRSRTSEPSLPAAGRHSPQVQTLAERDFGDMTGVLSDFDAQLDAGQASPEPREQSSSSRLGHSGFERRVRTGSNYSRSGIGAPSSDPGVSSAPGFDSGESGLFPVERQPFGFLDDQETEGAESEPTLAQVVSRQRKHIMRLEREVEYQKSILQALAEMLVEARVLSRRKLKTRLKELREKEAKRSK
ncbi:hypothetical protein [Lujinxingia litoralis]|nr:hypothetical protein [Lujinxingia litoralis]